MITNLFSIFDPNSSLIFIRWLVLRAPLMIIRLSTWKRKSSWGKTINFLIRNLKKEVKFTLNKTEKRTENLIITLFYLIIALNFVALYPQIFSATSHLNVNLPLSLTFWLRIILFGWLQNTKLVLSHLLPQGTPNVLISFIVLIELTRNLIRPITLCVRLTANLIAGHLLITLLGGALLKSGFLSLIFLIVSPIALTILETAVAMIQSYVFITLVTLYVTEVK